MILQRFSPEMVDPSYDLEIKSTLTIKPEGFFMRVRRRPGKTMLTGIPGGVPSQTAQKQQAEEESKKATAGAAKEEKKVKIFYGGNSGTCEGFSEALATSLSEHNIQAQIAGLDSAAENLSNDTANIIITASYEGQPPDNAKKFISWLQKLKGEELKGVKYSVMGVGNSDWVSTFHRIPKLIDEKMQAVGAQAIVPAGYSNVKADLIGPFEDWSEAVVKKLVGADGSSVEDEKPALKVSVERSTLARDLGDEKMGVGTVLKNDLLADTSVGLAKKHMEVRLPAGMAYESGDYLVIQPRNPDEAVHRVMRYFGYDEQTMISVAGSRKKFLPSTPTAIDVFLRDHIELGMPVTKRQLKVIAGYAKDGSADNLLSDETSAQLIEKRYSVVEVLIENSISVPFDIYIDMLLPLTPRQYSISSSPLAQGYEEVATITYDVHQAPAFSGHGVFEGACSTFLSARKPGDTMSCFVRTTNVGFRLPGDTETPIMMFAAGTGIAPMRAFLQERAAIATAGSRKLGPALLFFGSRDAQKDFLYQSELERWEKLGVVTVYPAHSRAPDAGTEGHPKYVQDAIWAERDQCAKLFNQGGKIYLCGSAAKLGQGCASVCKKIYMEKTGKNEEEAEEWLQSVKTDRYVSDVY
jgi:cytochrome P450/NADPH-cytochrome P450 reductase